MTPLRHNRLRIFDLRIGDCVMVGDVPYTAERALRGGMGLVILLRQKSDCVPLRFSVHGLSVALKTVLPEFISKESTLLFRRELAVWAGFRHPNIINLNEILDGEADGWIAAMHWCVGSLRDVISKHHRLPLAEATRILGDIIAGLSYAHEKDAVLHLDLKPENILYDGDIGRFLDNGGDSASLRSSRFMISDWGIASVKQSQLKSVIGRSPTDAEAMRTFNNMGTLSYMAPERFIRGVRSSVASDIFSLGMIYLELLVGRLPFRRDKHPVESLLSGEYFLDADSLLEHVKVPTSIRSFVLAMLVPAPNDRPASYTELDDALGRANRRASGLLSRLFN